MKFLIAKVPAEHLDMGGDDTLFSMGEDKFYYEVELTDEQVTITDTCGRFMPIDREQIEEFTGLFCRIDEFVQSQEALSKSVLAATACQLANLLNGATMTLGD